MTSPDVLPDHACRDVLNECIRLLMSSPSADGRAGEYARLVELWNAADRVHREKGSGGEGQGRASGLCSAAPRT
ncbi:hypothetical protein E0L36_21800 [Streptomyces sp. AJS327]|uniref:hypothetical protein n=1 Tax=Streptomyces sp. AJS327 TaxID=2545265 RepID=UPI0015DE1F95|nr:hypothetical protein [Streptomyces sp. AJS327]MBA0053412.1 hypothetical protein [Streptomyces sp. AJS327]